VNFWSTGRSGEAAVRFGYRRRTKLRLPDRLAELRVCLQHGWDLDIFRGKKAANSRGASGAHRLINVRPFALSQKIEFLRVTKWQRFGNSVRQLRNVFYLAESLGIHSIELPTHACFYGGQVGPYTLTWGKTKANRSKLGLEGFFNVLDAFGGWGSTAESTRIFRDYLRPLVAPALQAPDPKVSDNSLVLHFRAGDVFGPSPHRSYGQPPLAFYLAAVEREQPSQVWLVFEDRSNPCVDATEAALRARGIEVRLQSGALIDDLRILMGTRRLVAGRGSFADMASHLSRHLERLYLFERGGAGVLRALGVEIITGKDAEGTFKAQVLTDHWTASADQRDLLLSYPAENLVFV
jgi:hypothetical protein